LPGNWPTRKYRKHGWKELYGPVDTGHGKHGEKETCIRCRLIESNGKRWKAWKERNMGIRLIQVMESMEREKWKAMESMEGKKCGVAGKHSRIGAAVKESLGERSI
jgi:hypothetical protein